MSRLIRSRAPLRLGLAGGGTDVSPYPEIYGGSNINVTISRYAYASIRPNDEDKVVFRATDLGLEEAYDCGDVNPSHNLLKLHRGVYERFVRDYADGRRLPVIVTTHVDAPVGSGLGSSSALVVALVGAYRHFLNLSIDEYDLARLSYDIERKDLGLAGGRQDHYAATFGGFNFMEFQTTGRVVVNPLRIRSHIRNELESSIMLTFSGVSRESAHIISAQSTSVTGGGMALEAMHRMKDEATQMKEALLLGDVRRMADILASGWEAKKSTAATVSTPEIEALFDLAFGNGALAGKLSGAGGGGFALFIVDPDKRPTLERAIRDNTQAIPYGCAFTMAGLETWSVDD